MNRRPAIALAWMATSLFLPASSLLAQNRDAEIRFDAAQRRFDGELAIFKAEAERYERAKAVGGALPDVAAVAPAAPAAVQARGSAAAEEGSASRPPALGSPLDAGERDETDAPRQ